MIEDRTYQSIERCETMQKFARYLSFNYPDKALRYLSALETKHLEDECNMILRFIDKMKEPLKLSWWQKLFYGIKFFRKIKN